MFTPFAFIKSGQFITATGGTITTDGNFRIHTFTTTGSFTFDVQITASVTSSNTIEYLIVAGGGGGGNGEGGLIPNYWRGGGGGGAGGLLSGSYTITSVGAYTGSVGAAGRGWNNATSGSNGGNSIFLGNTAIGGGYAGSGQRDPITIQYAYLSGQNGGSGGGGVSLPNRAGSGSVGQGNNGGQGVDGTPNAGGGGGGASQTGSLVINDYLGDSSLWKGGNGGSGSISSISGTPTYYAGGGAGGGADFNNPSSNPTISGTPGLGGGGSANPSGSGGNGTNSLGGGGGSGQEIGGNGGSGVVIVRYRYQ
jgi:hypothetical protein